jgi:complement component 1 Q subcomponent-binding protein, mitochondrial
MQGSGYSHGAQPAHAVVCHASKSTISNSLISVLKDELKYARESYRRDEQLLEGPPNDFELDNPPGKKVFYLLKEYNQEQIIIEVDLDAQPAAKDEGDEDEIVDDDDDDEDEEEEVPPVAFKVQINKEGGCMTFECESNGEYVVIMDLAMEVRAGLHSWR